MNKKAVRLRSVDIINIIIMVLLLANLLFLIKIKSGPTQRKNILIDFEKLEGLKLTSSDGSLIDAAELLRNKENYILFFKLTDCPACIYSGLEQAQRLRLAGNPGPFDVLRGRINGKGAFVLNQHGPHHA